MNEPDHQ